MSVVVFIFLPILVWQLVILRINSGHWPVPPFVYLAFDRLRNLFRQAPDMVTHPLSSPLKGYPDPAAVVRHLSVPFSSSSAVCWSIRGQNPALFREYE